MRPERRKLLPEGRLRWSECERLQRRPPARNQHWAESVTRPQRVLRFAAWISAALTAVLGVMQTVTGDRVLYIGLINLATAVLFIAVPLLSRWGNVLPALAFV